MVTIVTMTPALTDYPALFREYVFKSTRHILGRVQQAGTLLPSEAREQAVHTLAFALKLPEAWPDVRTLLLAMAPKMEQAGYRDEWMPYLRQGIDQSQQQKDLRTAAELQLQLGILYELRGKYDPARNCLEASEQNFDQLNRVQFLSPPHRT